MQNYMTDKNANKPNSSGNNRSPILVMLSVTIRKGGIGQYDGQSYKRDIPQGVNKETDPAQ